jgi:NADH-quinone oxidoreductase subunit F
MKKIRSIEEFTSFRNAVLNGSENNVPCLIISAGTCGQASGANDIMRISKKYIFEKELQDKVHLRITGCLGFCEIEPCIFVEPFGHVYPNITSDDVPAIINAALRGTALEGLLYREEAGHKIYHTQQEIPFFKNQHRVILGKNQELDPIRIFNYISAGGYAAFEKIIKAPDPSWIIQEVLNAGLRGRGGAGFPAGEKWKMARNSEGNGNKFIICNADEGDPGAYMDRNLLEGNPHSIIEGIIIAGIAIGASQGYIYVRDEYPLAIKHVSIALRQAYDLGILGNNILNSKIDFNLELIRGAGAFVCGEETALIQSIEGKMGHPRQRPPFPVDKGLRGHPTCINNVETLANIPAIINLGSRQYASIGIPGNTGTKIFSLVGKIKNTGLVEVPLGTSIRTVVYDIGGGAEGGAKIKAIQTGGPSGGCLPEELFDLSIDYKSLAEAGAIMGSGGMIVSAGKAPSACLKYLKILQRGMEWRMILNCLKNWEWQ